MRERRPMLLLSLATGLVLLGSASPARGSGDYNDDGVVDFDDFASFIFCMQGPDTAYLPGHFCVTGDFDEDLDIDVADFASLQRAFGTMVVDTVPVGNPGNLGELSGVGAGGHGPDRICGAVDYVYNVGKFEVTVGQYVQFLNAVAAMDTHELYNTNMWSDTWGCKIERIGLSGSYSYAVASDWANRPVNYVSWGDAARFANWLHNGQPTGAQDLTTTEDGSYFLDGEMSNAELLAITREPDARWVIPSEDEWYKAAYHFNDGVAGNYFDYPTSSDSVPSHALINPDPGNNANFWDSGYTLGSPYYRTEVGDFENSDSPYGTFDQGGNVWEWNEAIVASIRRGVRGGGFLDLVGSLHAANRGGYFSPSAELEGGGFRVAEVP